LSTMDSFLSLPDDAKALLLRWLDLPFLFRFAQSHPNHIA
jgi:hypothetical protein